MNSNTQIIILVVLIVVMIFLIRGGWHQQPSQGRERFGIEQKVMQELMDLIDNGVEIETITPQKFKKWHNKNKVCMILLTKDGESPPPKSDGKTEEKEGYYGYGGYGFPSGYYGAANWPPNLYSSFYDYPNVARRASIYGHWLYNPYSYPYPGRWVNYLGNYVYANW